MFAPDGPVRRVLPGVVIAVLVLGFMRWSGGAGAENIVDLPSPGSVAGSRITDGTPVFTVNRADGEVLVFNALAPALTEDQVIGELLAWCRYSDAFVAGHHGRQWSGVGDFLVGRTPGRLPTDVQELTFPLQGRQVTTIPGQLGQGEPVQVGDELPAREQMVPVKPNISGPLDAMGPPGSCQVARRPSLTPAPPLSAAGTADPPIDHAFFAGALPSQPDDGWRLSRGALIISADGSATWCRDDPGLRSTSCARPHPIEVELGLTTVHTGGVAAVLAGPMGLRISDGVVTEVAVMFSTEWRGSSLRGATAYDATIADFDDRLSRLLVEVEGELPTCVGATQPPENGMVQGAQYVDVDTDLGTTVAGARVHVVVDRATCRALLVEEI